MTNAQIEEFELWYNSFLESINTELLPSIRFTKSTDIDGNIRITIPIEAICILTDTQIARLRQIICQ